LSTLSKVFVVLVLLVSIVFAMSSLARLAITEKTKADFLAEQKARTEAESARKQAEDALKTEKDAHAVDKTRLKGQLATAETNTKNEAAARKTAEDALADATKVLNAIRADQATMKDSLVKALADVAEFQKKRDEAVAAQAAAEQARLDAEERLKDAQNKVKVLTDDNKNKDVQITDLLTTMKKMEDDLKAAEEYTGIPWSRGGRGGLASTEPVAINGMVTDVQRQGTEVWVQVSVGSDQRVKEGTRFIIYGDGVYKGDVRISKVFPNTSIGVLVQSGTKEVVKGDRATTQLKP
jgi:hypothetical protein